MEHPVTLLSLVGVSALLGIGMLWAFRRFSNQAAIRQTKRRISAHIMELRLFVDEPALILKAQKDLMVANVRLIGLVLRPVVVLALPMTLLLAALEPFYGNAPLAVGEPAIVTMRLSRPIDAGAPAPVLEAPGEIRIETPPVRALGSGEVSWRVRPLGPASGKLRILHGNQSFEKTIAAGPGLHYCSGRRASGLWGLLLHPGEKLLSAGGVEWIEVSYPPAALKMLGLELHWIVWFLVISMAAALAFKKRMGVAF
ncbi:MAG: hypothetical protein FJW37_02525 [Acidobacteria bacterium]|nr:hypothetical protein [Acidobacteriota bacterium]